MNPLYLGVVVVVLVLLLLIVTVPWGSPPGGPVVQDRENIRIQFKTHVREVAPLSEQTLSRNGPYLDLHVGEIDSTAPIGQTYYMRPVSVYNAKQKTLTITLSPDQPPVHMNSNRVSSDVWYSGQIKISDFQYDQYNPDSKIEVDVKLHNGTGKKLVGLHVHDGKRIENGPEEGFTNFGNIVYFLRTTPYWLRKKQESSFPLPENDVTPQTAFTLRGENDFF